MKKQNVTRLLALVLAAVMLVSLCSCQLMQNAYSQGSYTPPQPEVEPDSTQQVLQYGEYEMTLQLLMERLNSRRSESNGLGLPLAKRVAELHGGSIRVESAVGQGSTFIVTLPKEQKKHGNHSQRTRI